MASRLRHCFSERSAFRSPMTRARLCDRQKSLLACIFGESRDPRGCPLCCRERRCFSGDQPTRVVAEGYKVCGSRAALLARSRQNARVETRADTAVGFVSVGFARSIGAIFSRTMQRSRKRINTKRNAVLLAAACTPLSAGANPVGKSTRPAGNTGELFAHTRVQWASRKAG